MHPKSVCAQQHKTRIVLTLMCQQSLPLSIGVENKLAAEVHVCVHVWVFF